MEADLSGRHRDTLEKIFEPANHNIEWREVVSLLEAVGDVTQEHNGKLKVSVGPEAEMFSPSHGKDVDVQTVVDLRRRLTQAGLAPAAREQSLTRVRAIMATDAGASQARGSGRA